METFIQILQQIFPDAVFYFLTVLVLAYGLLKCCGPLLANAAALRRGAELIEEGAKAELQRPVWKDPGFLGKRLEEPWRAFLQSAELSQSKGIACDVAEHIHEDNVIHHPSHASIAEMIPGICTSIGILGTFVGLSMGLNGLDVMEISSLTQLTSGIALAFHTSIVGIIASLCFNFIYKNRCGHAQRAMQRFIEAFYTHAIPQPADPQTQLLAYQQENAESFQDMASMLSATMASELHQAITSAFEPVRRTMDDYIRCATTAQIQGVEKIANSFVDHMDSALEHRFQELGKVLEQTAEGQRQAIEMNRSATENMVSLTKNLMDVNAASQKVLAQYGEFVEEIRRAYEKVSSSEQTTSELLAEMSEASIKQARYLAALQEYQAKLQGSFQDYTVWTDKFVGGLEMQTAAQNESLEQVAMEMRASSNLLSNSYKSFVESVEVGLANALGLFDENMQTLTRQIHGTLREIEQTMASMQRSAQKAEKSNRGVI